MSAGLHPAGSRSEPQARRDWDEGRAGTLADGPLTGIRVVELAIWGMVPMTGTILSEWGADVIKVEHTERADPLRTNIMGGRDPNEGGVHYMWEMHNRGKRGITLDLVKPEAQEVFRRLIESADVFL